MNDIKKTRETFKWGRNYDKNENRLKKTEYKLLKDLSNSHILGILKFFTINLPNVIDDYLILKEWKKTHILFIDELQFRLKNNIIIKDYS